MMSLSKDGLLFLVQSYYYETILAAVISVVVTFFLSKALKIFTMSDKNEIPGKLGLPFLGETFSFLAAAKSAKGCYEFVRLRRKWYGSLFKTRMFGQLHVFTASVECAKTIFANDFVLFNKEYMKSIKDMSGEKSLICVPHDCHKKIRRLLSDPFSRNALSKFIEQFDNMLCERLKKLEQGKKSFSLLDFTTKITFDAMCDMLMSVTDASLLEQIKSDCDIVSDAMLSLPVMIPGTRYYKGIKARRRLMDMFGEMIARRRNGKESSEDLLQSMIQRDSFPLGEKLDDNEIKDNILTLLFAGESTTAAALMWSVKYLSENMNVLNRLREEQLSVLGEKPLEAPLTLKDLNKMSYGSKVVKETLRMSNVVLWFPYAALNDCTIEGFKVKKGCYVNIDATCIHYDPALYKDPMQFNPSRFDEPPKPYSYMPFGSGQRTCLGINMAKFTMLVFLHRLVTGYKWRVHDLDSSLERNAHIPRLSTGYPISLTALNNG